MQKVAVFAFGLAILSLPQPAAAQTPAQRQACEQDAYRLCGHAIPDEARVKQCLIANMRRLNPICRSAFQSQRRR